MKSILLIDHGSTLPEANEMLACMANLVRHMLDGDGTVRFAHMELAAPSIADGFAACVNDGANHVVAFPYMLSPGKHSTRDIPRMVAEVARNHPGVSFEVTPCFGVEAELAEVILRRAGFATSLADSAAGRCWNPDGHEHACGSACTAPASR
jgi:sirohydrochlorin ferrochelatase